MWIFSLTFLFLVMFHELSLAQQKNKDQAHRQNVKVLSKKKASKKAKPRYIGNEQISTKYDEGKVFKADAESIKLSSLLFYGTPYKFGGKGSNGLDCSAFVQKVFKAHGINLPRDSRSQAKYGYKVSLSELKPGDLLFFRTYRNDVSHVGIYLG
ncbi:C40 family peptidase, partial [Thermocrinis sp.]